MRSRFPRQPLRWWKWRAPSRGADAVYVALACQESACLITLDDEMLKRSAPAVLAMTPGDWLRQNPGEIT